jgi:hypothetical protein
MKEAGILHDVFPAENWVRFIFAHVQCCYIIVFYDFRLITFPSQRNGRGEVGVYRL